LAANVALSGQNAAENAIAAENPSVEAGGARQAVISGSWA
jgi:hypothetical protein